MLSTLIAPDIVEYLETGKIGAQSVAGERIIFARPGPSSNLGRTTTSSGGRSRSIGRPGRGVAWASGLTPDFIRADPGSVRGCSIP